jgi:hypothetical protein
MSLWPDPAGFSEESPPRELPGGLPCGERTFLDARRHRDHLTSLEYKYNPYKNLSQSISSYYRLVTYERFMVFLEPQTPHSFSDFDNICPHSRHFRFAKTTFCFFFLLLVIILIGIIIIKKRRTANPQIKNNPVELISIYTCLCICIIFRIDCAASSKEMKGIFVDSYILLLVSSPGKEILNS